MKKQQIFGRIKFSEAGRSVIFHKEFEDECVFKYNGPGRKRVDKLCNKYKIFANGVELGDPVNVVVEKEGSDDTEKAVLYPAKALLEVSNLTFQK